MKYVVLPIIGVLVLVGNVAFFSSWNPVEYGTVEAVTEYGALTGEVFKEGLNWKTPFIQGTREYSVLTRTYETSEHPEESQADFTDFPVTAQTSDGQQIEVTYTAKFRIDESDVLYVLRNWGDINEVVENVVKADSRSWSRKLAQNFEAEGLFSGSGIQEYETNVRETLTRTFKGAGVTMVDFLVRKITFDPDYVQAIENQQIEQERIQTAEFTAQAAEFERDAQIRAAEAEKQRDILLAEANAQKTLLNAEANAQAIVLEANAQAGAIRVQGEALRSFSEMMQWTFLEQWNGVLPIYMTGESITPLLPLEEIGGN